MPKENFLPVNFQLPNHYNELCKAEELIEKLKKRCETQERQKSINDCTHTEFFEEIVRILLYVGQLSEAAFNVEDQLEALYTLRYKCQPALGKQLWWEHYDEIHRPYSLLKNRCFRLLEALDDDYVLNHGKLPPNSKV